MAETTTVPSDYINQLVIFALDAYRMLNVLATEVSPIPRDLRQEFLRINNSAPEHFREHADKYVRKTT